MQTWVTPGAAAKEDEIARLERVTGSELGGAVVLVLGDAGQANLVRRFRQRERKTRRSAR
jgi:hypothetical protein